MRPRIASVAVEAKQVERQSQHHAPAKSKVTVCEWEDGTMKIHYRGRS